MPHVARSRDRDGFGAQEFVDSFTAAFAAESRRCELSHVVSSAFCLKLVSFLQALHLRSLRHALLVGVNAAPQGRHCVT